MGRHAFGSFSASRRSWWAILRQCTGLCLLVDISYQAYHKTYLWIRLPYLFENFFVFELQWILLVFAFWPHQKTGFEASERNKDASHAPTARKLILDALHTIRVAAFLARASPNRFLKTKRREEERRERKEKEGRGERGEREKRRQQTAPLNGPSAARAYELCSLAKRCTRAWIVFIFLARFSYVGGAFLLFLPARQCSKMHAKAVLRQEDGRICPF